MKPASQQRIAAALDDAMRSVGGKSFPEGIDTMCNVLEKLIERAGDLRTREAMNETLVKMEDLSLADELLFIAGIRALPLFARLELKKAIVADPEFELPGELHGPELEFSPQEETQICDYISGKQRAGLSLTIAQQQAVQRFGGSFRTIQRAWNDRKKSRSGLKRVFGYLKDLLK